MRKLLSCWTALAVVACVVWSISYAKQDPTGITQGGSGRPDGGGDAVYFTGESVGPDSSFNAALTAAVNSAFAAASKHGITIINYEVDFISGQKGGFTGYNTIRVRIRCPKNQPIITEDR